MEIIFAIPGLGISLVQAMSHRDYPTVETCVRTFSWIRQVGLPEADIEQILERTAPSILHLG